MQPTVQPGCQPSYQPQCCPSAHPNGNPTSHTSHHPLKQPSDQPASKPSGLPTSKEPANYESISPSRWPSACSASCPSVANQETHIPSATQIPSTLRPTTTFATRISVHYTAVNITEFKIILPFLFTKSVIDDGLRDIILSAPVSGSNFLQLGGSALPGEMTVSHLLVQKPAVSYDLSGRSVSNAGDVNGDGYDDLIIGVPYAATCCVLFGTKRGFVNMTEGFTVFGAQSSDLTGWSVRGAGDVNNDTFADMIIGAPYATNAVGVVSGAAYVLFGRSKSADVILSAQNHSVGVVIYGGSGQDSLGLSVSGAGFDDVIIGALLANSLYSGAAFVIYGGSALNSSVAVEQMTTTQGFTLRGPNYSWFGYSVSGAGKLLIELS